MLIRAMNSKVHGPEVMQVEMYTASLHEEIMFIKVSEVHVIDKYIYPNVAHANATYTVSSPFIFFV